MKKITLFIVLLLMTFGAAIPADAQYVVKTETTQVVVANPDGDDVVSVWSGSQHDDKVVVRVAGMEIVLGNNDCADTPAARPKEKKRVKVSYGGNYQAFLELGVNMLPDPGYGIYSGMTLDGPSDFMELNNMKSLHWAFSIADMAVYLNRRGNLAFSGGLQLVFDDYVFSEQLTLAKENGILVPKTIDAKYKKSKLTTFSVKIPVMFHIGSGRSFHLSAGVYGGVLLQANTKIKKPVDRMRDPYMSPFYYGVSARLGFRDFYVFANYGLSEMFKEGRGPEVAPVTIGLGIGL